MSCMASILSFSIEPQLGKVAPLVPGEDQRCDAPGRLLLTRGLRLAARALLASPLHDINAGCRGYRKEHVEKLSVIKHRLNFIGPELFVRARLHDLNISEIVVQHAPRESGESSHPLMKIPGEVLQVLKYLWALRRELKDAGRCQKA